MKSCQWSVVSGKFGIGLTSAMLLVLGLQAQAAAAETLKPGAFLLAQTAEPKKGKAPVPAPPIKEPGQSKLMEPAAAPKIKPKKAKAGGRQQPPAPDRRMYERGFKSIYEPPAAAGTKKMGGQTIRDKEAPEGE